jgi:hypothetical protein
MVGSWVDVGPKRKFFEDYAKEHGFDPLVAENWYIQPRERILSTKVCSLFNLSLSPALSLLSLPFYPHSSLIITKGAFGVIYYHNKNIVEALQYMFPEIDFDESKFSQLCKSNMVHLFIYSF